MKIKVSTILTIIIYHICCINLYYVKNYNMIIYLLMFIGGMFLLTKIKYFLSKQYKKINILLILFIVIIIISSLYNGHNVLRGIVYSIKIIEMFLFWEYINQRKETLNSLKIYFFLTICYLIITDVLIIVNPLLFENTDNYFIGNKFNVSYTHITLAILYLQIYKEKIHKNIKSKCIMILFFCIVVIISVRIECTTAIIGFLFLILLMNIPKSIKQKIVNPKIVIAVLIICGVMPFFISKILNTKVISYIIVNIFKENLTLTGRTNIFQKLPELLLEKIVLGYGYGNSYEILMKFMNAPNTQNGVLECIFNYGILGTGGLFLLIYNIFKNLTHSDCYKKYYPIIINLYIYLFLATIEITIGLYFFMLLSIINFGNNKYRGVEDEENRYIND